MQINKLYSKLWKLWEEENNKEVLQWIRQLYLKHSKDVDVNYILLEALSGVNMDAEHDQEEPRVIQLCTEIIRSKDLQDSLTVAKAYTYRGEIRFYAVDRRKDFDKAIVLLDTLDRKDNEVKFLREFIEIAYPLNVRQYLLFNTNALNMFLVD